MELSINGGFMYNRQIMEEFIKQISDDLIYISHSIIDGVYHIRVKSKEEFKVCPRCHQKSQTVHTRYVRNIQDLPIGDNKVILELETYKLKCINKKCTTKVFSSRYSYIGSNCYKTKRLEDKILEVSTNLSSIKASKYLNENIAPVCKSSICDMIKKNQNNNK